MAVGRYAPSPTGTFHIGNLRTALLAWLIARRSESDFLLRWDDLDLTADQSHEITQRRDLAAFGIDFDGIAMRQSERIDAYQTVLDALRTSGQLYRCWCSRKEVREAAAAPHGSIGRYPGTCRDLSSAAISERERTSRPPAWRLRSRVSQRSFRDTISGNVVGDVDDFVLQRGDGTAAYNLAVVVDDAAQGVEQVVRADDLLASTARQAYLGELLRLPEPTWTHVSLCTDEKGERLAKRDGSAGLSAWEAAGGTIESLLRSMARTFGMDDGPVMTAGDLLPSFDIAKLPTGPSELRFHAADSETPGPELSLRL